jgi:hypothetical protein
MTEKMINIDEIKKDIPSGKYSQKLFMEVGIFPKNIMRQISCFG